jgi:glycine hydroxymethyltransferase
MHQMQQLLTCGMDRLARDDAVLARLIENEVERQSSTLNLVASSSITDPSVQWCQASVFGHVTAEGYPGKRLHGGCDIADEVETLAIERAKQIFGAQFANVQAHSASIANELILLNFVAPGSTIMGMRLDAGGHLTHGSAASVSGRWFRSVGYGLTSDGVLDYDQVRDLAHEHRPMVIICGTTAYPRKLDFRVFRQIADEVGALLLADITHIAGLVAAGLHQNPVPHAHFVTTCTHKQLYGPRGGLILMGEDRGYVRPGAKISLQDELQRAVFPFFQGAPILNMIAAKACAFHRVLQPEFRELAGRIKSNASDLAAALMGLGYKLVSNGTDNHLVLCEVLDSAGVTGIVAQRALESSGINVNKNLLPNDTKPPAVASGIRLGSNSIALRQFDRNDIEECADLIDRVLRTTTMLERNDYSLDEHTRHEVASAIHRLCRRRPVSGYPVDSATPRAVNRQPALGAVPH